MVPPSISDEGTIPNPLDPPDVGPITPPPLVPPDDGPTNPPPLIPPAVASKEFKDYINWAQYNNLPNQGVWLKGDPDKGERGEFKKKLDDLFGVVGTWIADGNYKGRNRVEWVFPNGTTVWWEKHPYDRKKGWPSTHVDRHYHVNVDGQHGSGFKGTD